MCFRANLQKLVIIICIFFSSSLLAVESSNDIGNKGLDLTTEADQRNSGFIDFKADLTMRIVNKQGDENLRKLQISTIEGVDVGDKVLTTFLFPKDIQGAGFLTHTAKQGADNQWIYLPAIKRVKKISSKNRRSPFFGSEFAFEDLASQEIEKYNYNYLREEKYEGLDCHIIERFPTDKDSGYSKLVVWMDVEHLLIRKIDYYDHNQALLKTLAVSDYNLYQDKFWRASSLHMKNVQNQKQTYLQWANYRFKTGLSDSDLDYRALDRPKI